jgi:hypothetical protein
MGRCRCRRWLPPRRYRLASVSISIAITHTRTYTGGNLYRPRPVTVQRKVRDAAGPNRTKSSVGRLSGVLPTSWRDHRPQSAISGPCRALICRTIYSFLSSVNQLELASDMRHAVDCRSVRPSAVADWLSVAEASFGGVTEERDGAPCRGIITHRSPISIASSESSYGARNVRRRLGTVICSARSRAGPVSRSVD